MPQLPVWYTLLDGPHEDTVPFKRYFTESGFSYDEVDGRFAFAAPQFEACNDREEVLDVATKLLDAVNVALRLSSPHYLGFELHGLVEKRDGIFNRIMFARGGSYSLSGAAAVAIVGTIGRPVRSKEERLVSLMARDTRIADIARVLAVRPMTWAAMNTVYESVVGIMSNKSDPRVRRRDFEPLIAKGWFSSDESRNFYYTAAYHRHGYPKVSNTASNPTSYEDACILIKRLFWRFVDEKEPN